MDSYWLRLYLVRHGHVAYFDEKNQPINPKYAMLSTQGVEHIQCLAEQLEPVEFEQIYSSTMPRSMQTAEILTTSRPVSETIACDEIREIRSGRLREIQPEHAVLEIKYAYLYQTYQLNQFMQGEAWSEFEHRVLNWLEKMILATDKAQNILVSSHDAVNRVCINWVYDRKGQDVYVQEQDYGCLNILDIEIGQGRILNKRIKLQNFTPYDLSKSKLLNSAMDDVYDVYTKAKGFMELKK
ncbi:MAG: histidine phosphatase family protein [Acinetobacter sp.]